MANSGYEPRLKKHYNDKVRQVMQEKFNYQNPMQMPKVGIFSLMRVCAI